MPMFFYGRIGTRPRGRTGTGRQKWYWNATHFTGEIGFTVKEKQKTYRKKS